MEELARRLKTVDKKHLQIKLVKVEQPPNDVRMIVFRPRGEYGGHAIEVVETLLESGGIREVTRHINELWIHAIFEEPKKCKFSGINEKVLRLYAALKKLGFKEEKKSKF